MTTPNPFMDLLEHEPQIGFYSHLYDQDRGLNQRKQRTLRSQFSDIQSQFLGMLGQQIRRGEAPTLRFNDFLGNYDFDDHYDSLSKFQREGRSDNVYTPRVRHLLRY